MPAVVLLVARFEGSMIVRRAVLLTMCAAAGAGVWISATADESKQSIVRQATLADIAWMEGTWVGDPDASRTRETWGRASDGAMLGMCHENDPARGPTYELILIEEQPEGLVYKIMHFGAGLKARHTEPRVLPVVELTKDRIVFMEKTGDNPARVSYRHEGPDRVVARVEHVKDGKATGFDIPMKRG